MTSEIIRNNVGPARSQSSSWGTAAQAAAPDEIERRDAMRFMMLMIPKGYEAAAPGTMPPVEAVAAMMKYNEALKEAGVLVTLDGLHPPSMGARISFAGGKPVVTDGPFIETKEVIGGYWMIEVKSKEEAIEWASKCPASDNETIELRQVQEMGDFPADIQEAASGFAELLAGSGKR
jgi:hypothetical protein